jgi:hypothetical protein
LEKKVDGPRLELPRQVEANGRRQPASALAAQAPQAAPGKRRVLGGWIADDPVRTMPVSRLGFFNLLKQFRAIATGYHKLARSFLAGVPAGAITVPLLCSRSGLAPRLHKVRPTAPRVPYRAIDATLGPPLCSGDPTYLLDLARCELLVESMKRTQHTPLPYR